jgi:predicted porin
MANITTGTTAPGGAAGSSTYPFANAWTESADDKNDVVGAGLHHTYENVTLDVTYTYVHSNSGIGYTMRVRQLSR